MQQLQNWAFLYQMLLLDTPAALTCHASTALQALLPDSAVPGDMHNSVCMVMQLLSAKHEGVMMHFCLAGWQTLCSTQPHRQNPMATPAATADSWQHVTLCLVGTAQSAK